ncbi:MAG: NADPH:quinone reductase [Planctomycetota bacterium]
MTKTMKAIWYEKQGAAAEVLSESLIPIPQPGEGEIRVKLATSGVNPSDTKVRASWGGIPMPASRVVPHNDGGGVIEAVGSGVSEERIGQRVWIYEAQQHGRAFGTCAEYVVLPERFAVPLPDQASFNTAAALGVPAMTAHRCLFADGSIQGKTVLVAGGRGGVGQMAIQLAKWGGARVVATVGQDEQFEQTQRLGADIVLNYNNDHLPKEIRQATDGEGVDRIIEVAFERNLETNLSVIKPNGVIATFASGDVDSHPKLPFYRVMLLGVTLRFVFVYLMGTSAHDDAAHDINAALADQALDPSIGGVYPFTATGVAQAHDDLDARRFTGKAIVNIQE